MLLWNVHVCNVFFFSSPSFQKCPNWLSLWVNMSSQFYWANCSYIIYKKMPISSKVWPMCEFLSIIHLIIGGFNAEMLAVHLKLYGYSFIAFVKTKAKFFFSSSPSQTHHLPLKWRCIYPMSKVKEYETNLKLSYLMWNKNIHFLLI